LFIVKDHLGPGPADVRRKCRSHDCLVAWLGYPFTYAEVLWSCSWLFCQRRTMPIPISSRVIQLRWD